MNNQQGKVDAIFSPQMAASYDARPEVWMAGRESFFGFMRLILLELPSQARILCVGAGTGLEVESLAQAFPGWHFTIVEPATAMIKVCRERIEANGLTGRCTFHEGFLASLPASEPYDAATCLLVSHFIMEPSERSAFFANIASLLCPDGLLVSSDLASSLDGENYTRFLDIFIRSNTPPQTPQDEIEKRRAPYGRDVAVIPPQDIEAILLKGGFSSPILFFQNLLIHAWYSRRAAA
jgi:tRNA (cmo5U34)-methyltransferase